MKDLPKHPGQKIEGGAIVYPKKDNKVLEDIKSQLQNNTEIMLLLLEKIERLENKK